MVERDARVMLEERVRQLEAKPRTSMFEEEAETVVKSIAVIGGFY